MDLQELISRGRFIFSRAAGRLDVYKLVDGRRTAKDISKLLRRHVNNIHRDLRALTDIELIQERRKQGQSATKDGFTLYEKNPLARTIPISYFSGPTRLARQGHAAAAPATRSKGKPRLSLAVPTENELLDMCKKGEDQTLEFKAAGTEARKITKEIAAMLNTRQGGLIFYGVDDDGTIQGSDVNRQKFDQPLQNSVKNSIAPRATITLKAVSALGTEILVVVVPPWNRRDVYQFDEKVFLRKGTNAFAASPEELKRLHRGEYVI